MGKTEPKWMEPALSWFHSKQWLPKKFQKDAWKAFRRGDQGLIQVPTGSGKTYAALFGPLLKVAQDRNTSCLRVIYVTPIKALANDIARSIEAPLQALVPAATLAVRTGDTAAYRKQKLREKLPTVLITTPESLALLLSYEGVRETFDQTSAIIIDEWHELLASKRGSLLTLNLSFLRSISPGLSTWGLTATIGNVKQALQSLLPFGSNGRLINGNIDRKIKFEILMPNSPNALNWAGHMGIKLLPTLTKHFDLNVVNLVFTNTRFQAERWYAALSEALPLKPHEMALHHGSIALEERKRVEAGLKEGTLKVVVSTSSLDLGVDFSSVEKVYQIGSPKSSARAIQRAGRSAHRPGAKCHLICLPTNVLEVFEILATKMAVAEKAYEEKPINTLPLDVLAQHLSNRACGEGFSRSEIYSEIKNTYAFSGMKDKHLNWILSFLTNGGETLKAYEQYHKLTLEGDRYKISTAKIRQLQRMNIGTITSDATMVIKFRSGKKIGQVEERYLGRLKAGDVFYFAGKPLKLLKFYQGNAYVEPSKKRPFQSPRWIGGKMALSPILTSYLQRGLHENSWETRGVTKVIERFYSAQNRHSNVPNAEVLTIEIWQDREGTHLFAYPLEGQFVNHAVAVLLAYKLGAVTKGSFSTSVNEFGFEILVDTRDDLNEFLSPTLIENVGPDDLVHALNLTELTKRHFREIARVAGLTWQNYPQVRKTASELNNAAGLVFDVYKRFEPKNPLLIQAKKEVMAQEFDSSRLSNVLKRLQKIPWQINKVPNPGPLAINLLSQRLAARLTPDSLETRIKKLIGYHNVQSND